MSAEGREFASSPPTPAGTGSLRAFGAHEVHRVQGEEGLPVLTTADLARRCKDSRFRSAAGSTVEAIFTLPELSSKTRQHMPRETVQMPDGSRCQRCGGCSSPSSQCQTPHGESSSCRPPGARVPGPPRGTLDHVLSQTLANAKLLTVSLLLVGLLAHACRVLLAERWSLV